MGGRRERIRRGGYLTRRDAAPARDALLKRSTEDRGVEAWTVARWLRYWLTTRTSVRPSTQRSYGFLLSTSVAPSRRDAVAVRAARSKEPFCRTASQERPRPARSLLSSRVSRLVVRAGVPPALGA
jgi:hypothetical protein